MNKYFCAVTWEKKKSEIFRFFKTKVEKNQMMLNIDLEPSHSSFKSDNMNLLFF